MGMLSEGDMAVMYALWYGGRVIRGNVRPGRSPSPYLLACWYLPRYNISRSAVSLNSANSVIRLSIEWVSGLVREVSSKVLISFSSLAMVFLRSRNVPECLEMQIPLMYALNASHSIAQVLTDPLLISKYSVIASLSSLQNFSSCKALLGKHHCRS